MKFKKGQTVYVTVDLLEYRAEVVRPNGSVIQVEYVDKDCLTHRHWCRRADVRLQPRQSEVVV